MILLDYVDIVRYSDAVMFIVILALPDLGGGKGT
jgi:hypothetical protein